MVSQHKKEYEIVLKVITQLYSMKRNYLSILETPFEVKYFL